MKSNTQPDTFPVYLHYIPFLPLLLCLIGFFTDQATLVPYLPFFISLILATVVYIKQINYLKAHGRKLTGQCILTASALVVPFLAIVIADAAGKAHFGENAASSGLAFMSLVAAIFSLSVVTACAMTNVFLIKPVVQTSALTKKILRVLGILLQAVAWALIAVAAYFGAALTYSMRDPSTE
jgi:hypothetical protein